MSDVGIDPVAEERLEAMTPDERSLLLFLEKQAVVNCGIVDGSYMNRADHATAERWDEEEFLRFCRLPPHLWGNHYKMSERWVVKLLPSSYRLAAVERRRRAERGRSADVDAGIEEADRA